MFLVLILYAFIYKAVYQRRVNRAKKLSTYQKVLQSYLLDSDGDDPSRKRSPFCLFCCYCCPKFYSQRSLSQSIHHQTFHPHRRLQDHSHDDMSSKRNPAEHIVLELNGARGKRYSAISMTSMTYLTSGVWDDPTSSTLLRSRINSITATTFCGTEQSSSPSRPSTSTEDSSESNHRSLTSHPKSLHLKLPNLSNATHLTVPGQCISPSTPSENSLKDHSCSDSESICNLPPPSPTVTTPHLLHPSIIQKPSLNSSQRNTSRTSDGSIHQRKVSFSTISLFSLSLSLENLLF